MLGGDDSCLGPKGGSSTENPFQEINIAHRIEIQIFYTIAFSYKMYVGRIWPRSHWKVAQILFKDASGIPAYKLGETTKDFNYLFISSSVVQCADVTRTSLFSVVCLLCHQSIVWLDVKWPL